MDYRAFLITVIGRGGYQLDQLEERIDKLWIEGKLTEADRDELMPLAAEHAADRDQVDVIAKLADFEVRIFNLEHPVDQYEIWTPGKTTQQHEIVRFDVTGDGELDLCQYNGGRAYTALSIGKIEGWQMLDRELTPTHTITRDAGGGYVVTPIEPEPEPETSTPAESEPEAPEEDTTDYSQKFVGLSAQEVWQSLSYRPTKREYQQACDWLQIAYEPTATNAELRALLAAAAGIEE